MAKAKCPPRLRFRGLLQRPKRLEANRNDHGEIDLSSDANWESVQSIRFSMTERRSQEFVVASVTEGVRFVTLMFRGTSVTRQAQGSWRIRYDDRDGVTHTLQFAGPAIIDHLGRWVTQEATEKTA